MRYTTIIYQVKKELQLTLLEYILLDVIHIIQNAPNNKTPGWSSASRQYYAEILELSPRQVQRYISNLIERDLLERNKSNKLRTTQKWVNAAYMGEMEEPEQEVKVRQYHERKCLFMESDVADWEVFKTFFETDEFAGIDIHYYYQETKRWSESKGMKRHNWIEQAKTIMSIQAERGKLKKVSDSKTNATILKFSDV